MNAHVNIDIRDIIDEFDASEILDEMNFDDIMDYVKERIGNEDFAIIELEKEPENFLVKFLEVVFPDSNIITKQDAMEKLVALLDKTKFF